MKAMLVILCCLHYYWFGMFMKILFMFVNKGETEDIQNKTEKTK